VNDTLSDTSLDTLTDTRSVPIIEPLTTNQEHLTTNNNIGEVNSPVLETDPPKEPEKKEKRKKVAAKKEKSLEEKSLHAKCKVVYESWCLKTDRVFDWNGMQAKSLNLITDKIRKGYFEKFKAESTDEKIIEGFTLIMDHLPDWYKENDFSLATINSKYSGIINQIKSKNGTASGANKGGFDPANAHQLIDDYFDRKGKQ